MKAAKFLLCIGLSLLLAVSAIAQNSRAEIVNQNNADGQKTAANLYQGSYALVIGESNYTGGWSVLNGVAADVPEIKAVLERRGFTVRTALDLKSDELQKAIKTFIDDYGFVYENRLLIYFAGHGHSLKAADLRSNQGYIVPVDAPLSKPDEIAFKKKAISMDAIHAYARMIDAKHAIFVFDSCFSGSLVSRSDIDVPSSLIIESVGKPVRQFITSGSANQTVPDDSLFRKVFVAGLDGKADYDGDGFILGSELAQFLRSELTNYTKRGQTPQYSKILDVDLNQGDFVFPLGKKTNPVKIPPAPTPIMPDNSVFRTFAVSGLTKTDICAAPGAAFSITANGNVSLGPNIKYTTPEGKDSFETFLGVKSPIFSKYYIENDVPLGALLCRFDYEDKWSYCSTSYTMKAEKNGCLLFEINDSDKTDNKGEYKVTVKFL